MSDINNNLMKIIITIIMSVNAVKENCNQISKITAIHMTCTKCI